MKDARWWTLCVVMLAGMTACNPAQQAKQVKRVVDDGNSTACARERATIEQAVKAFMLLNPDAAVENWIEAQRPRIDQFRQLIARARTEGSVSAPMLAQISSQARILLAR